MSTLPKTLISDKHCQCMQRYPQPVPLSVGMQALVVRRRQDRRACPLPSSARKGEVARHGGRDPGNLLALGGLLDARPHRFEGHFNIPSWDSQFP